MQFTIREASRLFNMPEKTIIQAVDCGELPACVVQEQRRIGKTDLIEWATARKIPLPEELAGSSGNVVQISKALQSGGVHYGVPGTDKKSVLAAAIEGLTLPEGVDHKLLCRMILAREEMASTGIGDGIAIPHVRNPIILPIDTPFVALCFPETPVEFGALDQKPVHSLFLLFSTSTRGHLTLLSQLMFALRDPQFQNCLINRAPAEQIMAELKRIEASLPSGDSKR